MTVRKVDSAVKTDAALAALGCFLALGSASFGVFMSVHGPLAGFAPSGGFSVFAQLAPHRARPANSADAADLDLTATASIPPRGTVSGATPAVLLREARAGAATLSVNGRSLEVHVGDELPGLGEVVAIVPGARPQVRTTRGVIGIAAER